MSEPITTSGSPLVDASHLRRHWALFCIQAVGALILLWDGIPLYREAQADPAGYDAEWSPLVWALVGTALIQIGHWARYRLRPSAPRFKNVLLATIVLFAARLAFIAGAALFSFVFITQKPGFQLPAFRYVVVTGGLFSLFCFTRELERLGNDLLPTEPGAQ